VFLITTADQKYWKFDEPVLFLGEWCKLYSQKKVWENLNYTVLPYHWDDRARLYRDYKFLENLYEIKLLQLSEHLNAVHCEKFSNRYWRIIVGPWLLFFMQVLYDRYLSLSNAKSFQKITNTYISPIQEFGWIPNDMAEFQSVYCDNDAYSLFLYSEIIKHYSLVPYEILPTDDNEKKLPEAAIPKINGTWLRHVIHSAIKKWNKSIPESLNRIVFVNSYLDKINLIKLQMSLGQIPFICDYGLSVPKFNVDLQLREKLSLFSFDNDFEKLLNTFIKAHIPLIYIEGYRHAKEQALTSYPRKPVVCFSANAAYSNEGFKFWAAYNSEKGAKIVYSQHGGVYGVGLWLSQEKIEVALSDKYFSWGWEDEINSRIVPLPSGKLHSNARKIKSQKEGQILIVTTAVPRYSYILFSGPTAASGYNSYLYNILKLIGMLESQVKEMVLVRLYPNDYGHSQKEQFESECPEVKTYHGRQPLVEQLNKSRLFVGTYNATTHLETIAADFPTILYWDPDQWELRPSAKPYHEKLVQAGILHYDPASAADAINTIYKDPLQWWKKPEIQSARDFFQNRFARISKNWIPMWKKELLS